MATKTVKLSKASIRFIHKMEWSVGNGQCDCCEGMGPAFMGWPAEELGHSKDCKFATLMKEVGLKPRYYTVA